MGQCDRFTDHRDSLCVITESKEKFNHLSANHSCNRRQLCFFFLIFQGKTSFDISCELSAMQTIHMNCKDLFSLKK